MTAPKNVMDAIDRVASAEPRLAQEIWIELGEHLDWDLLDDASWSSGQRVLIRVIYGCWDGAHNARLSSIDEILMLEAKYFQAVVDGMAIWRHEPIHSSSAINKGLLEQSREAKNAFPPSGKR